MQHHSMMEELQFPKQEVTAENASIREVRDRKKKKCAIGQETRNDMLKRK